MLIQLTTKLNKYIHGSRLDDESKAMTLAAVDGVAAYKHATPRNKSSEICSSEKYLVLYALFCNKVSFSFDSP